jgi:hypothetical protein
MVSNNNGTYTHPMEREFYIALGKRVCILSFVKADIRDTLKAS